MESDALKPNSKFTPHIVDFSGFQSFISLNLDGTSIAQLVETLAPFRLKYQIGTSKMGIDWGVFFMDQITKSMIENLVIELRGKKVLLDSDLAALYGVETKHLNRQVMRNLKRFPEDFSFELTREEWTSLVNTRDKKLERGGKRKVPRVFTELGVAMLSSVLNSDKAIEINIQIMRVFVGLRDFSHKQENLERKLNELEAECDSKFKEIFDTLEEVVFPTLPENRELIGIKVPNKKTSSDND